MISSMCVVFAETEIIGLLASGVMPADIVAGVQASLATRVAAMTGRNVTPPIVLTGGVAMVPGMEGARRGVGATVGRGPAAANDLRLRGGHSRLAATSSPLKKGTGFEPRSEKTCEDNGREVPVPFFNGLWAFRHHADAKRSAG